MCFSMDFLQSLNTHVRVNLRRVESGVTKELLQRTKVCAVFHHQRGRCVSQQVTRASLRDADANEVVTDQL